MKTTPTGTGNDRPVQQDDNTITSGFHHGDCCQLLRRVPDDHVDLIVTDPPFFMRYINSQGRQLASNDNVEWLAVAFDEMYRVLKPNSLCVSTYAWCKVGESAIAWQWVGFRMVGQFVWTRDHTHETPFTESHHHMAYVLAKGNPLLPSKPPRDVFGWRSSERKLLPSQAPANALKPIIKAYSRPGQIVLDPFAGSASTAIAAWSLGRRFMGMEIDAEYTVWPASAWIATSLGRSARSTPSNQR